MRTPSLSRRKGFTLTQMLVAVPVGALALFILFTIFWTGTKLLGTNLSINLAHINVIGPMQRLTDDLHNAVVTPVLTGTLTGASGVVPTGYTAGGTKNSTGGRLTGSYSLPVVTGSGPAAGVQVYLLASSAYAVNNGFGPTPYNGNKAGFAVAQGAYTSSATSVVLEVADSSDESLLTSATNGMRLCIPSAQILVTGNSYAMLDKKITGVSFSGALASGTANTRKATCTISGVLGTSMQTDGTRANSSAPVMTAYLVTPVNYFVCGTDLIRLNYDGKWQVAMRNVLPTNKAWTQAQPFSMPWPYTVSPLNNGTSADGQRAVSIRLTASNPTYTTDLTRTSAQNSRYRGAYGDMLLYDIVIWSRMQLFDELAR